MEQLHGEVARLTDWRGQLARHQRELMIGAAGGSAARRSSRAVPPLRGPRAPRRR